MTRLPRKVAMRLAEILADFYFLFSHRDKKAIVRNLEVIFAFNHGKSAPGAKETLRCTRRIFRNFAKYLVDFLNADKIDKEFIGKYVKIENWHYVDDARRRGKGVIIVTAHIGNWELGGITMSVLGYPFNVIALSHDNKRVNRIFLRQRIKKGVKVIPLGMAVKKCFTALKKGEILALLGDRDFSGAAVRAEFFGKSTLVPRGPAEFCIRTGAPLVPGFVLREPDDTYRISMQKPIDYRLTGDDGVDTKNITGKVLDELERMICGYPDQWYMFRKFWNDSGENATSQNRRRLGDYPRG